MYLFLSLSKSREENFQQKRLRIPLFFIIIGYSYSGDIFLGIEDVRLNFLKQRKQQNTGVPKSMLYALNYCTTSRKNFLLQCKLKGM